MATLGPIVIASPRPVKAAVRHPLPNVRRAAEQAKLEEGAQNLFDLWRDAWKKYDAAQTLLLLSSAGYKPEIPQQQVQGQQEPRELAPPVPVNSNGRHPLPTSRPKPKPEAQPQKKRKRVEAEEENEDDEQVKKRDAKKKKKGGKKPADPENPKPFKCNACGKGFPRQDHLTRHVKIEHGSVGEDGVRRWEVFGCDGCRQLFTRKDNLRQHRKQRHPQAHEAEPGYVPRVVLVTAQEKANGTAPSRTVSPSSSPAASGTITASPTPDAGNGQA